MRTSEAQSGGRGVQRHIVEHRADPVALELIEHFPSLDFGRHQDVVQMSVMLAMRRYDGAAKQPALFERCEHLVIAVPCRDPSAGDIRGLLELSPQEGGGGFAGQERRAEVLPCVLVDLASKKGWAVFEESRTTFPPSARPAQISKCSTQPELETFLRRAGFADVRVAGRLDFWTYAWGVKPAV